MSKEQFLKENQKAGEAYAGLILGQNGEPDYHLFIIPGEAEKVTWSKAKEWAKKAGGDLPTRREQRVLFANAKEHFKPEWYWSGEQHASYSGYAWGQDFGSGFQGGNGSMSFEGRARAVRRLEIHSVSISMALHTALPIYKVAYDLFDISTDLAKNMPRDFKHSIGGKLRDECVEIVTLIFRANVARDKAPQPGRAD